MTVRPSLSSRVPLRARFPAALIALLSWALTGCVTTYQPLTSLQRPVVVDPTAPNLKGQRMLVRCFPGGDFSESNAQYLCRRLRTLYSNQGAQVDIEVPVTGKARALEESSSSQPAAPPDLVVETRSRLVHEDNSPLLWILSGVSLTLIPAVTESTSALDVVIRDREGFLLVSDSLQARFVRHFGAGIWAVNTLLNMLVRSDEEDMGDKMTRRDLSRDLYGQFSQLAFHARLRAEVLRGFAPEPPRASN